MSLNTKIILLLAILVLILGSIRLLIDLPKIFKNNPDSDKPIKDNRTDNVNNNIHNEVKETKPNQRPSDCPDAWYINEMPTYGEEKVSNEYLIKDGERHNVSEFDKSWLKDYCNLEPQILY
ncbi:MAG TPA: hypothetical protein VKO61_00185 [Candidatus Paceibacterota bacterium]|nr:hypothetical protein [Candidatus Paceibacterota bacterium]